MEPCISIVIPTYNNFELFINAMQSVYKQTMAPKEIIIVDDSSDDKIEKWCNEHPGIGLKYFHNQPAKGAVMNWNNGLYKATGEWIILLHHDEEFTTPNYLETLSVHFNFADIIISDIRVKTRSGIRKGRINDFLKKILIRNSLSLLVVNSIGPCACICFKREFLTKFDTNLTWLVDVEWYMRLLQSSKKVTYDTNLIIQSNHGHSDQITNNINIRNIYQKDVDYLKSKYRFSKKIQAILTLSRLYNHINYIIRH